MSSVNPVVLGVLGGLLLVVLVAIAVVAAGRGRPMVREHDDAPDLRLPTDRPVSADDLRRVRFPSAWRGYRRRDVEALLDRLAREREDPPAPGAA